MSVLRAGWREIWKPDWSQHSRGPGATRELEEERGEGKASGVEEKDLSRVQLCRGVLQPANHSCFLSAWDPEAPKMLRLEGKRDQGDVSGEPGSRLGFPILLLPRAPCPGRPLLPLWESHLGMALAAAKP